MASAAARERYARKSEAEDLKRAFARLDRKGDGRIDADELAAVFAELGYKARRGEAADLIWEADEDCDSAVDWAEFQALHARCHEDAAGVEPRGLYNVAEFLARDRDNHGTVSLEVAMEVAYLRHGRAELDARLEEVFGTSDLNAGLELTLGDFTSALHRHQVRALLARSGGGGVGLPRGGGGSGNGGATRGSGSTGASVGSATTTSTSGGPGATQQQQQQRTIAA